MSDTYPVGDGDRIHLVAPEGGVKGWQAVRIGLLSGLAGAPADEGDVFSLLTVGEFRVVLEAGAFVLPADIGTPVYMTEAGALTLDQADASGAAIATTCEIVEDAQHLSTRIRLQPASGGGGGGGGDVTTAQLNAVRNNLQGKIDADGARLDDHETRIDALEAGGGGGGGDGPTQAEFDAEKARTDDHETRIDAVEAVTPYVLPELLTELGQEPFPMQYSPVDTFLLAGYLKYQPYVPDGTVIPVDMDGDGDIEDGEGYPNTVPQVDENGDPVYKIGIDYAQLSQFVRYNLLSVESIDSLRDFVLLDGAVIGMLHSAPDRNAARKALYVPGLIQSSVVLDLAQTAGYPTKAAGAANVLDVPFTGYFDNVEEPIGPVWTAAAPTWIEALDDGTPRRMEIVVRVIDGNGLADTMHLMAQRKNAQGVWVDNEQSDAIAVLNVGNSFHMITPRLFEGSRYKFQLRSTGAAQIRVISAQVKVFVG